MPRKKSGKTQWTDPVILVPIIVAVITGTFTLVSTIVVPRIEDQQKGPTPVPTPPVEGNGPGPAVLPNESFSVRTDKNFYGFGDYVKISGSVKKPAPEKTVRIDV